MGNTLLEQSVRPDEQDLLRQARRGDDEAFARLVRQHTPQLYRVVRRMSSDPAETEAVVQETFLRTWRSLGRYKEDRPFFPYLVTVALNIARDQWRRDRWLDFGGLQAVEDNLIQEDPEPEDQVAQADLLERLAQAVADLPDSYRAVIALRYDAGLDYQAIAQALGLPVNTVRTHLRRAKAHLRGVLEGQEQSHG